VADAGRGRGVAQVRRRGGEELLGHRAPRRRHVRHVDHRAGAGQRRRQPGAGDQVDTAGPGQHDRLVPAAGQAVHDVPAGEAGAARDRDPHRGTSTFASAAAWPPTRRSTWSRVQYGPMIRCPRTLMP
jgi:hypothetical protein